MFNHEETDYVVCPWCGYKYEGSHEFYEYKYTCDKCNKLFEVIYETWIYYTTKKVHK
jgi:DNA-directed RNA polymerase subunit RPC12/RpoP